MRSARSPGRAGIRIALPVALVALLVMLARRDRLGHERRPDAEAGRERIVAVPLDDAVTAQAAAAARAPHDALAEIQDAEKRLNRAREDLEGVRREIEARQRDLERLREDADADARRSRDEMERARRDLERRRGELEEAARDADRTLQAARDEMERQRREQLEAAAGAGVARGLGGGANLPAGLDPRLAGRGRPPPLVPEAAVVAAAGARGAVPDVVQGQPGAPVPATPGAAALQAQAALVDAQGRASLNASQAAINERTAEALALQNRLVATEVFFERRRVNRAARAAEAGPRPTLEQVVRCAAAASPPRLDGVQLDRVTGEIAWPSVLTDPVYRELTAEIESGFRARASWGGSPGFTADEMLANAIDALVEALRSNVSRYPGGRYGEARVFLESLRAEVDGHPYD